MRVDPVVPNEARVMKTPARIGAPELPANLAAAFISPAHAFWMRARRITRSFLSVAGRDGVWGSIREGSDEDCGRRATWQT
jgi:hypothetical protein